MIPKKQLNLLVRKAQADSLAVTSAAILHKVEAIHITHQ